MRTHPVVIFFVPLAFTLAGCPVWMGEDSPPGISLECSHDPHCEPGTACDGGTCIDTPECFVDTDCAPNQRCQEAACVARPSCSSDVDCDGGEYCTAGRYCDERVACTVEGDCPSGMWCGSDALCAWPAPGTCRSDDDCDGGQLCIEDYCQDFAGVCQFDYQCGLSADGDARSCVNNGCDAHCEVDADCQSSGTRCASGYCVEDHTECTSADPCGEGETCFLGRCLASCAETSPCVLPNDACGPDGLCRPTWEPTPLCQTNEDCQTGSECVDGVCRAPCPEAPLTCLNVDVQLTHCNQDTGYCEAEVERTPECFSGADCGAGERCVNAICRNID